MKDIQQFFVKSDEGTLTLMLDLNITLDQLKDIIEKRINYPKNIYFLKYNGHGMYDNKTLKEYKVLKDGTIHICVRNTGKPTPSVVL